MASHENKPIPLFDLTGEVAIVTGGQGRLGSQYAKTLAHAGARVAVFDISPKMNPIVQGLLDEGLPVSVHTADNTVKKDVERAVAEAEKKHGALTILINNAGLGTPPNAPTEENGPFENYPEASWDIMLDSHLKGMFLVSREIIRRMKKTGKGGVVINVSSTYGLVTPEQAIYDFRRQSGDEYYKPVGYSVAKSGVLNFTRWLAEYGARWGIRANTLVPGGVYEGQDNDFVKEYEKRTILGRMAHDDDYNGAVLFLASKASSYMTGAALVVDGGWTAR